MTQSLSKQTPNLVVVNRNSKVQAAGRATEEAVDSARAPAPPPAAEASAGITDEDFAGFVFEEVSGTAPLAPAREAPAVVRESAPRSSETPVDPAPVTQAKSSVTSTSAAPAPRTSTPPTKVATTPRVSTTPAAAPVVAKAPEEKRETSERPSQPASEPPASPSMAPMRADLELRSKLNQKEAELLALRSELSLRDRLVLDLNNASLEIERSRTELSEQLEQTNSVLQDTMAKLRSYEADKELLAKRIEDMKLALRRSEDSWKRKNEAELGALRAEHSTQLSEQAAAHAVKLERLEQEKDSEIARLHAAHAVAMDEAKEKHSEAMRAAEAASSKALANAVSAYTRKVRALQDAQEQAMTKAAAADAAKLEAAMAVATSEKASALAEADSTLRATQNELATTRTTVDFLQGAHAAQLEKVAQQEAKINALEESLRNESQKAAAAADTLANLRRAFAAGLNLLNAHPGAGQGQ